MSIILNDNFSTEFNKPLDNRYGPFVDVATALSELPSYRRFIGLTVAIGSNPTIEYWFNDGILDTDFVQKIPVVNYPVTSVNGKTGDVVLNKADIGLGNVDNTSDINKPISTLVQNALNLKEGTITAGTTAQYWRGDKTFQTLDKTAVGLSNVDNTSDLSKPISSATQTALNGKQATISLTTTGSSGASTFAANVLNIPNYTLSGLGGQPLNANLTSISALTYASTSFVKMTAAGTFALDTNTYLTAESDTLASVTGRGNVTTNAITVGAISSNKTATLTDTWANYQLVVGSLNQGGKIGFVRGDNGNINSFIGQDSASGSVLTMDGVNGVILKSNGTDVFFATASQTQIKAAFATAIIQFKSATTTIAQFHSTTGNFTLQNGGTFTDAGYRLDVNGTARIQNQLTTTGSITAASAIARGVYMNNTLVAAANNDVLVGLDIAPTFTNGAFTGVKNYFARFGANTWIDSTGTFKTITDIDIRNAFISTIVYGNKILLGTSTDAGYRLDVVGADSRFNGIRAGLGAGQVAGNTVFGDGALGSNVSGTGLTAIGYQALRLSTGNNNTGVGNSALWSNTTGTGNTALGESSLAYVTTSSNNTAIGKTALAFNTAPNNTAIGSAAAYANTSGTGITAVGYQALTASTGAANTAIGFQSLSAHTTGTNNTALGHLTASGNFSGCLILGKDATATANNQFVVGSSTVNAGAVATASVTQTKTWDVIINGVAQKILLA